MGSGGKRPVSGRKPNPAKGLKAESARRLLAAIDYESELLVIHEKLPPQQRWQVISKLLDFAGTQPPQTSKKNDNQVIIKFLNSEQE